MAAVVTFRALSRTAGVSASTVVAAPTGVTAGDMLVAAVLVDSGPISVTSPGWTPRGGFGTAGHGCVVVLTKPATASEPTSYTFTVTGTFSSGSANNGSAVVAAYPGGAVVRGTQGDAASAGGLTSVPFPSLTTLAANDKVVRFADAFEGSSAQQSSIAPATGSNYTARASGASGTFNQFWLVDEDGPATPGTTTSRTFQAGGPASMAVATIVLGTNSAPNAPIVQVASTLDSGAANVITAPFSDPDPGDSCSQTDFEWWDLDGSGARVGAAHTATVTGAQPTQWTSPAVTFTDGPKEIKANSYDALGVPSGWGASAFFTASTPTGLPTITAPTNGGTISTQVATVAWSTAGGQAAYRVRRVADNAGAANTGVVYWDSGAVTDTDTRSIPVTFETNNRYEHIQVAVSADGTLWSGWADARELVSYSAVAAPTVTLMADSANGVMVVGITNPAAAGGAPAAASNNVWVDDGDGVLVRKATGVGVNTPWTYWTPPSGFDGVTAGLVLVEAVGTNGTSTFAATPTPAPVYEDLDGGTPSSAGTDFLDGGSI